MSKKTLTFAPNTTKRKPVTQPAEKVKSTKTKSRVEQLMQEMSIK